MLRNSSIYDSKATLQNNLKGEKRFFKIVCAGGKMMAHGSSKMHGRCMTSNSFKLVMVLEISTGRVKRCIFKCPTSI